MNTTQPLTDLQQACDLYCINNSWRDIDGRFVLMEHAGEWPAGATAADISASLARINVKTLRTAHALRAYRDATPTESMVVTEATEQAEVRTDDRPTTRGDEVFAVAVLVSFWVGSVCAFALAIVGAITVWRWLW